MTSRTRRLQASPGHPTGDDLETAARLLRTGHTVAFATETVYGLGAHALDPAAVAKIFEAKQRPSWDPLIVHISTLHMLPSLITTLPPQAGKLIERFWPGPLTLLLPRSEQVPDEVTAGRDKVGIRMPAHPVAHALIAAAGIPVAAPSANLFGHVSPTTAAHVLHDLDNRIDAILDSGPTQHGLESTVVDAATGTLYRPGAITLEQLRKVWPSIHPYNEAQLITTTPPASLPSPGVGIRHYAPRATVELFHSPAELLAAIQHHAALGEQTGLLLPTHYPLTQTEAASAGVHTIQFWASWNHPEAMANELFAALRSLDQAGVAVILCPLPNPQGIGAAIADRLRKAARKS